MSRFEWADFISFMTCFSLDVNQNIGLKTLYLPFGDHPKAWIQSDFQNVVYVSLLKKLFL